MNNELTFRRLCARAIVATVAAGILSGCNASDPADRRADALVKAIPAALQR